MDTPQPPAAPAAESKFLFDIPELDASRPIHGREDIGKVIPHRGNMMLIDGILWHSPDFVRGIGVKNIRDNEFWCAGHFPDKALYPGVLQIESAAQLAAYLYYRRFPDVGLSVFCKIEEATFRAMVAPGDDLLLLCRDIRVSRKRFLCDVMGVVRDKVTFQAKILGMSLS
ncbi:MAG: hypothetical protein HEQ23_10875 [Tepidisphaera sp.]|jgi:3-hydroxyacyl-[acyl-carrier-protein] dehydratase